VLLGQAIGPASSYMALQALALLFLVRWRLSVDTNQPHGSTRYFALALCLGTVASLCDAGTVFLILPIAYLLLISPKTETPVNGGTNRHSARQRSHNKLIIDISW